MRIKKEDFLPKIDVLGTFSDAIRPVKSRPWDSIVDFATHRDFAGNNLYPRQNTLLKLMYLETENMTQYDLDVIEEWSNSFKDKLYTIGVQEDVWDRITYLKDNGYDHFPRVMGVMGRRASKGHIGGIVMSERMAYLVSLDDPQAYFGIDAGHDIYSYVIATSTTQAQKFLFADLLSQVRRNKWLRPYIMTSADHLIEIRTPADIRQTATLMANKTTPRKPLASLKANPVSSNSGSSRGGAVISAGFDEFAFTPGGDSQRSGELMYNAIEPSLDQFGKDSLIYIPSSPWNKVGKFFKLYEEGSILLDEYLEREGRLVTNKARSQVEEEILSESKKVLANPEMLIVQLESWGLYQDWEESPRILSKTNTSYPKRAKSQSPNSRITGHNDQELYVQGAHALEIGDSILIDEEVVTVADVREEKIPGGTIPLDANTLDVIIPGPKFVNAIQVKPNKDGNVKERAMAGMESSDPDMFRVERRAQFLSTQNPFLDRHKVEKIFGTFWKDQTLEMQDRGVAKHDYYMHCDPAKSGADFAVMIAHTEKPPIPDVDGNYHDELIVDWYKVYQPKDFPEGEVNYLLVIQDLKHMIDAYPTLRSITMDQFNSVMPLQTLRDYARSKGRNIKISEQTFTNKWNQTMFSATKTAINLGWVHSPTDTYFRNGQGCLLEQQLLFLEEINGKVEKGNNAEVRKDDLVDCLGTLIVYMLGDQINAVRESLDKLSMTAAGQAGDREKYAFNPGSALHSSIPFDDSPLIIGKGRSNPLDALNNLYGGR